MTATRTRVRRRGVGVLIALTAGLLLVGTIAPEPAPAHHVRCGDTITEDTVLDADLRGCPGNGLVIGADGITLDLGGHVVDGRGEGMGIRSHGFADVRIENGVLREFVTGVSLGRAPSFPGGSERGPAASGNVLRGLQIVGNRVGVSFFRVHANTLERSFIARNGQVGVVVSDAAGGRNVVDRNTLVGNGNGIHVDLSSRENVVSRNRVVQSDRNGIVVGAGLGAPFTAAANLIVGNVAEDNGADGIHVVDGRANLLHDNRARRNGDDGIDVDCSGALCAPDQVTLSGNVARRNGDLGIEADAGTGDGGGNRARHNGNAPQCTGVSCR